MEKTSSNFNLWKERYQSYYKKFKELDVFRRTSGVFRFQTLIAKRKTRSYATPDDLKKHLKSLMTLADLLESQDMQEKSWPSHF